MNGKFFSRRYCALLTILLMSCAPFEIATVQAKSRAQSTKSQTMATASWGAVITTQGSIPQAAIPFTNAWSPLPGTQILYIDAVNYGSLELTGQTFVITTVDPNSSRQNSPKITFDACVGATWDPITNSCSGSVTAVGTSSNQTVTSNISIPQSGRLSMRLTVTKTTKVAWSTTLNITVNRTQVRPAITQNS